MWPGNDMGWQMMTHHAMTQSMTSRYVIITPMSSSFRGFTTKPLGPHISVTKWAIYIEVSSIDFHI